jgi:hypothetical protein
MTKTQKDIYQIIEQYGPISDQVLVPMAQHIAKYKSSSGIRSRRAELADKGLLREAGRITLPSGRRAATWEIV